eukprot:CAMPEP_0179910148 /NCGR_PEP_ID=MMETSP0982-20121206/45612_1 /TAXON_ID=483367 /ORGANISM="non described non described, Strain CCMP 2436" /LENGTH=149 /DNA_ID=CAMNT_0021811681 /DNA_START=395 /DNA_END=844 /DNA_ORIENTATION=-
MPWLASSATSERTPDQSYKGRFRPVPTPTSSTSPRARAIAERRSSSNPSRAVQRVVAGRVGVVRVEAPRRIAAAVSTPHVEAKRGPRNCDRRRAQGDERGNIAAREAQAGLCFSTHGVNLGDIVREAQAGLCLSTHGVNLGEIVREIHA